MGVLAAQQLALGPLPAVAPDLAPARQEGLGIGLLDHLAVERGGLVLGLGTGDRGGHQGQPGLGLVVDHDAGHVAGHAGRHVRAVELVGPARDEGVAVDGELDHPGGAGRGERADTSAPGATSAAGSRCRRSRPRRPGPGRPPAASGRRTCPPAGRRRTPPHAARRTPGAACSRRWPGSSCRRSSRCRARRRRPPARWWWSGLPRPPAPRARRAGAPVVGDAGRGGLGVLHDPQVAAAAGTGRYEPGSRRRPPGVRARRASRPGARRTSRAGGGCWPVAGSAARRRPAARLSPPPPEQAAASSARAAAASRRPLLMCPCRCAVIGGWTAAGTRGSRRLTWRHGPGPARARPAR